MNSSIPNNTAAYYRLYYSNNTAIAPVQKAGGLVTAKTAGTTTIRCKLSNGKEAICKVTVKSAPSRVTVSDKSATLKVGQSKTLKATLNNNAYSYRSTWTSSNTYVATVNSTGKSPLNLKEQQQSHTKPTTENRIVQADCFGKCRKVY